MLTLFLFTKTMSSSDKLNNQLRRIIKLNIMTIQSERLLSNNSRRNDFQNLYKYLRHDLKKTKKKRVDKKRDDIVERKQQKILNQLVKQVKQIENDWQQEDTFHQMYPMISKDELDSFHLINEIESFFFYEFRTKEREQQQIRQQIQEQFERLQQIMQLE